MIRCLRCVIPDTRPDTHFEDGICSACRAYENRPQIDWAARKAELLNLLDRHNGKCIVPSSGGKDSTAQVLMLKELGADPIAVTASTCMLTQIGRKNIDNLGRYAETIEYSPNRDRRARLNRIGLEMVGDISHPEHMAIFTVPFRAAIQLGRPLLFFGENPQSQYGGPPGSEEAKVMTLRWRSEFGGFLGLRPSDLVSEVGDMSYYEPPSAEALAATGVEAHFLGQYLPWDSHANAMRAKDAGMKYQLPCTANRWDFENLDNASTGLHDVFMRRKYGFGRGAAQISVDVRTGLTDRDYALKWVEEHDGRFPYDYMGMGFSEVLDRIGLSETQFMKILQQFTNWDLFEANDNFEPTLKC